jgi:formate hydrogenlyase transcriptional activator
MEYKDRTKGKFMNELEGQPTRVKDMGSRGAGRRQADEKLQKVHAELEQHVKERTEELTRVNEQLLQEIEEHRLAEESLQEALKEIRALKEQLQEENLYLQQEVSLIHSHKDIVGNSEAIMAALHQIEQVAGTESTVLIQGETGSGKELIAHSIHNLSSRKGRLMVKVNCAALPPTLIESELFGREKGAFTGALSKQAGRFELADRSTIFLDEIDALPLEVQAKLLRVLESGEFERLGSSRTVKIDARIISATNCDLGKAVSEGEFREDLYYRLNVFQIAVPAKARSEVKIEYNNTIEVLQHKQDEARTKLHELKSAGDEAWEDVKTGAEKAWAEVKTAFHSAASKFK